MTKKIRVCIGLIISLVSLANMSSAFPKIGLRKAEGMNLLIITLDTTRADRIGAYGYEKAQTPYIDDLAEKGIRFSDCYSSVPLTLPAHCSLFTGRTPLGHRVRDNGTFLLSDREVTLAEMMNGEGFVTFAVVASFVLMAKFGLDQGFSVYDDSLDARELLRNFYSEIPADVVYAKFKDWFGRRGDKKFFAWVHFYDPHLPYEPPEKYGIGKNSIQDMYDGEVAFVDFYVGKIIEDLESSNARDDTLIVIVGDHGEAFGEHEEYGHSVFCYEENLKVPLVFSNPRLFPAGRVVEERVSLIDIMPTLLDLYGLDRPGSVQGISFRGMLDGKKERGERSFYIESMYGKETLGWAPLAGIIDGPYKYISLPEPELYDLKNDPREMRNLYPSDKEISIELDKKLKGYMLGYASTGRSVRRELTPEDRRRLESLGYISSSSTGSNKVLDPKQGIVMLNRFNGANNLIDGGRLDEAEAELKNIVSQNPGIHFLPYYELLAKVHESRSDHRAALETWKEAVQVFPENDRFRISLGFKFLQMGQLDEAEAVGKEVTRIDEKSSRGFILLARIEESRGNNRQASAYFENALRWEPNNVQLKLSFALALIRSGQKEKALNICQSILDERNIAGDPADAKILSVIGLIYTEGNMIEKAHKVLTESIAKDDSDAEAWNNLGVGYYRKKDYPKAIQAYERAVSLNPGFAQAFNNLGTLYLRTFIERKDPGMIPKAIDAFDRAIRNDPRIASAYNGRASAFKFSNRAGEAIKDWNKALELLPDFVDVYFNLGITYLETGEKTRASDILNLCKKKFYNRLSPGDRDRLDRLIAEAIR